MDFLKILFKIYQSYSNELGINLKSGQEKEIFKWFLASMLFAKPIRDKIAMKTYKIFESAGITSPRAVLERGWNGLVELLDEGGYTRYDFSTADKLIEVAKNLEQIYDGSLIKLYKSCQDETELREKIKSLGKGIGDGTVNIFFRELREIWNVNPSYSRFTLLAAKNLGIKDPKAFWKEHKVREKHFVDFETALLRLGKDYCRKRKCDDCFVKRFCKKYKKPKLLNQSCFLKER